MNVTKNSFSMIFLLLFLSNCGAPEKPITPPKAILSNYILIFIDKTLSFSDKNQYVIDKYNKALLKIIQENIKQKNDKIEVYFVHDNTAGAKVFSSQIKAELPDSAGLNPTDLVALRNDYQLLIKKQKNKIIKQSTDALLTDNANESGKYTDLLATINIIDKKNGKKKENTVFKVFYLSDMVESMPNMDKRDFHKRPPYSAKEAAEWAVLDAKKFTDIDIENVEITYVLPYSPMTSGYQNNPNVVAYWQKLFEIFGVDEINELEN